MIKVDFYDGYKGEEKPSKIFNGNDQIEVKKILSSELHQNIADSKKYRIFVIEASDGRIIKLVEGKEGWQMSLLS